MSGVVTLLRPQREDIPEELKARSQWVVWRLELREGEPKPTKVPYCTVDRKASSTDPTTWLSFDAAWALYERDGFDGVGYVFSPDDAYCGIDLDPELPAKDRETILKRCRSYTELSPSGRGQHIVVKATLPSGGRKKGPIEVYDRARYFTITGQRMSAYPPMIEERQETIDWLLATYFSRQSDTKSNTNGSGLDATDDKLLARAFDAANGDKLRRLWNGDTTDYPSASEADMALASLLAFWTGPDAMKLETLMRSSGLARGKWDKRHYGDGQTYLEAVVTKTLIGRTEFYAAGNHAAGGADRQESALNPEPLWPTLAPEALQGLAGEIVRAIDPYTEADPVAVLVQLLCGFGNLVRDTPHFRVEFTQHPARFFFALVGETAKARKGTSWSTLRRGFTLVDERWAKDRMTYGLSSGEGLIHAVRDPRYEKQAIREKGRVVDYQEVLVDEGVSDKRLLLIEEELASVLKVMAREGNILSPILRQAWDSGDLHPLTKANPIRATGAHVSIIGHVTKDELLKLLNETEQGNGFANRFIWLVVKRSKCLPKPKPMPDEQLTTLAEKLKKAIAFAATVGEVDRDSEADKIWEEIYSVLSEGRPGMTGAILARAEAQVMRLALCYALLDCSSLISLTHLNAAIALWDYAEASARFIFGNATGDAVADRILEGLRIHGELSESDILHRLFQRNMKAERVRAAVSRLHRAKLITSQTEETAGRTKTLWRATA